MRGDNRNNCERKRRARVREKRSLEGVTKGLSPRNMVLLWHFAGFLYCANVQHFVMHSMEMQQIE